MKITKIDEACEICGVKKEFIIHFIEEEWIHPVDPREMKMDDEDLARIRLIRELIEEFGVNDEGMSIILQLLDQLNRMHLEIEKLHQGELL
jgi:chaperone modulatory protein CbpM